MEVFVARQPILDKHENLFGYELLYRNGQVDFYNHFDGDHATIDVLVNSFVTIGVDKVSGQKKCFINFTENLILKGFPTYFPTEYVVVEILENIEPTEDIIQAVKELKRNGFMIALDDFVYDEKYKELIALADIIKVEFPKATFEHHKKFLQLAKEHNIKLLAEKVETREEFELAVKLGYFYFQGYFFSKPVLIKADDVPVYSHFHFEILNEINKKEPDIDTVTSLVERDVALSYKLLKVINTAAYEVKHKVTSIKQAIVLLGLTEVKRWITIISLSNIRQDVPKQALQLSLSRAKVGENLSGYLGLNSSEIFMLGMFSIIDVLLHRPMDVAIEGLPFSLEIKEALLGGGNIYANILSLMRAIEQGDWVQFSTLSQKLNLNEEDVMHSYTKAIEWSSYIVDVIE